MKSTRLAKLNYSKDFSLVILFASLQSLPLVRLDVIRLSLFHSLCRIRRFCGAYPIREASAID